MNQEKNKDLEHTPLLDVRGLKKYFHINGRGLDRNTGLLRAVDNVSFHINSKETYGLVGESGCGKSTTGRTILRLTDSTSGEVIYKGKDVLNMRYKKFRNKRKDLQMIFQDPLSSLNPRKRVGQILKEPLNIQGIGNKHERTDLVIEILNKVGMQINHFYRFPHELSGGQRQRIGIARALITKPKIVIADEPVSALDVSIQSQLINLLQELQESMDLSFLFISHDLSVVRHIANRVGVMYLGKIVEETLTDNLFSSPLHPYSKALLSSIPLPNPKERRERIILKGEIPSPISPPAGCVFHTRCPYMMEICKEVEPKKTEIKNKHFVACHLYND